MSNADLFLNNQRLINIGLLSDSQARTEQNATLREQLISGGSNSGENRKLRDELEDKEIENIGLQREVNFYKDLLSKPMHEIAHHNESFKKTYDLQQELLANWMVSQKAFKELAIKLGLQVGLNQEDVINQGMAGKNSVLNSENDPIHNTNANTSEIIKPHIQSLKDKIK